MVREADYLSYVLRLWQAREDGEISWRASLQTVPSGERQGFASLEELFDYLLRQTTTAVAALGEEDSAESSQDR
jgi:hypothetical protein